MSRKARLGVRIHFQRPRTWQNVNLLLQPSWHLRETDEPETAVWGMRMLDVWTRRIAVSAGKRTREKGEG